MKLSTKEIGINQKYFEHNYKMYKKKTHIISGIFIFFSFRVMDLSNSIINGLKFYVWSESLYLLSIILFIAFLYLNSKAKKHILLTDFGEEEYLKWRALYNFINDGTLLKEKAVFDVVLWEQFLVYATAFGISDKVSDSLEFLDHSDIKMPLLFAILYRTHMRKLPENSPQRRLLKK